MGEMILDVNRGDISYIRFILEGYDGLGIVTTKDPHAARIKITYPISRKDLITRLVNALKGEGVIRGDIII